LKLDPNEKWNIDINIHIRQEGKKERKMLDNQLRGVKDVLCSPFVYVCSQIFTATQLTLLGFLVGLSCLLLLLRRHYAAAQAVWLLNRLIDGLDGAVARATKTQSDFGGFIDITCDFIIYSLIPIAIVASKEETEVDRVEYLALALLEASYFVNNAILFYLSAVLEKKLAGAKARGELTTVTMPVGFIEGTETLFVYCAFIAFPQFSTYLFVLFTLAVVVTSGQRIIWAANRLNTTTVKKKKH